MAIKTPEILPGEPGYVSKAEKTKTKKETEKKDKATQRAKDKQIGKIKPGSNTYRIGKLSVTPRKEKKYPVWRYSKKIGEITVSPEGKTELTFRRFGGVANFKHLIQDADFQLSWAVKEQELLLTQKICHICNKPISKSAKPNLYHYNLFKFRTELLEHAEKIPSEVVEGKLTIEEGWERYNDTLEEGNRYYMSLKETALICSACAKKKNLE